MGVDKSLGTKEKDTLDGTLGEKINIIDRQNL
jgi:hypothetical protein